MSVIRRFRSQITSNLTLVLVITVQNIKIK